MSKKSPYIIIAVLTLVIILVTVLNIISKNASRDEERPDVFPFGEINAISEFVDDIVKEKANGHGPSS